MHPNFSGLYQRMGLEEQRVGSMRKAMALIKAQAPDIVICVFEYGYANNYAGVNISNLDVMLFSMQRYSPDAKVVVLATKSEIRYVDKLQDIFPLQKVLQLPASEQQMEAVLQDIV